MTHLRVSFLRTLVVVSALPLGCGASSQGGETPDGAQTDANAGPGVEGGSSALPDGSGTSADARPSDAQPGADATSPSTDSGTTETGSGPSDGGHPITVDGGVADVDGNVYTAVSIGTQVWLVQNLMTTKLNDGTPIPLVSDASSWSELTSSGYAWANNDMTNKVPYGALYNGYAVTTGKLAPAGWHVATAAEWNTLATYLGGVPVAGGKLKEAGYAHWESPNTGATNETGFTALPGGYRDNTGAFLDLAAAGGWWSSTAASGGAYDFYFMDHINSYENDGTDAQTYGFSVRCVKD